ncbi:lytic transglycosylase domain-containing protein [Acidomonas methanolica]|uniref:Transclycosylase n=1 Tax=Acidomonas methanolica NBRC 104435 TaxID=1231351 RepID=A0A023D6N5_ACIMT|nr:lytic transglycosylase domain-containing protein [Acidomonas methanolica]TCS24109.1 transglycosylase-like protein with SLT domain [Acidomonas methanolica]GAJ29739.1 transclycosylase [Acidomonas methanolica NBRC 104435]GEL00024.1 hypothetical protein AME01nite_25220 [Acidomonas methanolica NBRC 104435]
MADDLQTRVDRAFDGASRRHNIDERWLRAIAQTESGGDTEARSRAGAIGLMQMTPDTARRLGVDPRDPAQAIEGAARLLDENLKRYGDPVKAMAAYNGGTDERRWNNSETRTYPQKVMENMARIAAKQDARKKSPVLDESIYGWDTPRASSGGDKGPVLDDSIYGWDPERPIAPVNPRANPSGFWDGARIMGEDTANAAGREIGRTAGGVAHLLGYLSSLGHHEDNSLSRFLDRQGDETRAAMDRDEQARAGDYGEGVSNAVGSTAGAIMSAIAGGRLVRPAASLLEGSRAGRIAANILKGEGNLGTRLANNALAAGSQAALDGSDSPLRAAEVSLGLGAGGALARKTVAPIAPRISKAAQNVLNYLDPVGAQAKAEQQAAEDAARMPLSDATKGVGPEPPQSAPHQKAEQKAQTKAVARIGAFTDPKKAAQAIISAFSGKNGTKLYEAQVPGVWHTLATRTRDVKMASLEDNMRDLYPDAFRALDMSNNDAYAKHLRTTIGTPEQIQNLERERSAFEQEKRAAAFENEQPVPVDELHAILDRHIADSRGNEAVKTALGRAKAALIDATDKEGTALPSNLWNVRKGIGYGLQQAASSDSAHMRAAASRLSPFMDDLAEHIDKGAPGFRDYLEGYSRRSSDIDSLRFLQSRGLMQAATDAPSGEIVNYPALKRLIGQIDKNEVSVARKGSDAVTPEQEGRLRTLYRDMLAERETLAAGRANGGSKTFKAAMTQRAKEARGGHAGGIVSTVGGLLGAQEGGLLTGGALGAALHTGNALLGHALVNRRLTNMERTDQEVINQLIGR